MSSMSFMDEDLGDIMDKIICCLKVAEFDNFIWSLSVASYIVDIEIYMVAWLIPF